MLDLKNDKRFRYILIFKNHGDAAGASLEHTHSQLIALPIVPKRVREEVDNCKRYYQEKERCIFCDMIRQEREDNVRVILENDHFIAISPYAPRFPFEVWLMPKQHGSAFENNQSTVYSSLAHVLKDLLMRLETVLDNPAYNLMIHTSPIGEETNPHYHWHIEIMPKLTKVAGFEWGSGFYICPRRPKNPRDSCAKRWSRRPRKNSSNHPAFRTVSANRRVAARQSLLAPNSLSVPIWNWAYRRHVDPPPPILM